MGSKTIRNFLRSSRRRGRGGFCFTVLTPRPQVTARGCSRAPSRVGRGGAVHTGPPAGGCGDPHRWRPPGPPRARPAPGSMRRTHPAPRASRTAMKDTASTRRGRASPLPRWPPTVAWSPEAGCPPAAARTPAAWRPQCRPRAASPSRRSPRGHRGVWRRQPRLHCSALPARGGGGAAHARAALSPPHPLHGEPRSSSVTLSPSGPRGEGWPPPRSGPPRRPPLCCGPARLASGLESSFPRHTRPLSVIAKGGRDPRGSCNLLGRPVGRLGECAFISLCGAAFSTSRTT